MEKEKIITGYLQLAKDYAVCARTNMGGYMQFFTLERVAFEDNAKLVAERYAELWTETENIRSICVRKKGEIIYEIEI